MDAITEIIILPVLFALRGIISSSCLLRVIFDSYLLLFILIIKINNRRSYSQSDSPESGDGDGDEADVP